MNDGTRRLRMFAGPNGSGKSVLKTYLPEPLLGVYLNADEIEAWVKERGYVDARAYGIDATEEEVLRFFGDSDFLAQQGLAEAARRLRFAEGRLWFPSGLVNSYLYIFDNSTDNADRTQTWLAEITDGRTLELKTDQIPVWFKRSVLDKIV